jgi:fatty acid desaturase
VNRHRFSPEITCSVSSLYLLDNWHGPVAAAGDALVIITSIVIGTAFPIAAPLAIFTIGARMRALATLLHESSHTTLAANPALNRAIGTVAGYSIFQTFEAYKTSHRKEHHPYTGNPDHDPDLKFHIEAGLYDGLTPKQFLWRHVIKPGLALNLPKTLKFLLRDRLLGAVGKSASAEVRIDRLMFAGFWMAIAAMLTVTGLWMPFLLWWVLPYLTTFQIVNYFCEFGEHFPRPAQTDVDIAMSRNRLGNRLERWFFSVHNEHLHLEHHLAPGIPFWNLSKAREARLRDSTYAALDAKSGGLFTRGPNGAPSIISQIMTWVASNASTNNGE